MWVSASLWVSRPLRGLLTSPTHSPSPLPNGLFLSLVHHPWAFMCPPRTSFILHGNLALHYCLAPLAIIHLCWPFFQDHLCRLLWAWLVQYTVHALTLKGTYPCSICERASSTRTPFPLQLWKEPYYLSNLATFAQHHHVLWYHLLVPNNIITNIINSK